MSSAVGDGEPHGPHKHGELAEPHGEPHGETETEGGFDTTVLPVAKRRAKHATAHAGWRVQRIETQEL